MHNKLIEESCFSCLRESPTCNRIGNGHAALWQSKLEQAGSRVPLAAPLLQVMDQEVEVLDVWWQGDCKMEKVINR